MNNKTIPRGNSASFTLELYDPMFTILCNDNDMIIDDAIDRYCIGWCYSADTSKPDNGKGIALMFENECGEKTWFHYYRNIIEREYILGSE